MTDEKVEMQSIDRKMSVIIALLLKIANNGGDTTLKDQIVELSALGMSSTEIAGVLGKKVNYISKELSTIKRKQK